MGFAYAQGTARDYLTISFTPASIAAGDTIVVTVTAINGVTAATKTTETGTVTVTLLSSSTGVTIPATTIVLVAGVGTANVVVSSTSYSATFCLRAVLTGYMDGVSTAGTVSGSLPVTYIEWPSNGKFAYGGSMTNPFNWENSWTACNAAAVTGTTPWQYSTMAYRYSQYGSYLNRGYITLASTSGLTTLVLKPRWYEETGTPLLLRTLYITYSYSLPANGAAMLTWTLAGTSEYTETGIDGYTDGVAVDVSSAIAGAGGGAIYIAAILDGDYLHDFTHYTSAHYLIGAPYYLYYG
jgi:hypothetical protein